MLSSAVRIRSGSAEEQFVKSDAGRLDMRLDSSGCGLIVSTANPVEDPAVLQLGFGHKFVVHDLVGVHEQFTASGGDGLDESGASRGYSDVVVEGVVGATIARTVSGEIHVVHGLLENRQICVGAALGCELCGTPFDSNAKLDDVLEFAEVAAHVLKPTLIGLLESGDERAALLPASGGEIALVSEDANGLSQRDAAYAQARCKFSFRRQPLARCEVTAVNGSSQFVSQALYCRDRARGTDRQHASKHMSCPMVRKDYRGST